MAREMEVGQTRMYEMLDDQCVYPKAKRLIRVIGKFNIEGVRLVKADLDAMFDELLGTSEKAEVTAALLHKEAFEAIDALLTDKPAAVCKQELRELIAVAEQKLEGIEKLEQRNGLSAA